MRQLQTGEPVWDLQFDENGKLTSPARGASLGESSAAGITDLFAFSHGWDTAPDSALALYNQMFPMIRNAANGLAGIGKIGFAGIYWPSMWFPPTQATPPPPPSSAASGRAPPRWPCPPGLRRCPAPTSRRHCCRGTPTQRSRTRSRRSAS